MNKDLKDLEEETEEIIDKINSNATKRFNKNKQSFAEVIDSIKNEASDFNNTCVMFEKSGGYVEVKITESSRKKCAELLLK